MRRIFAIFLIVMLSSSVAFAENNYTKLKNEGSVRITPVVMAVQKAAPAVVSISTDRIVERAVNPFAQLLPRNPLFDEFFQRGQGRRKVKEQTLGSGVIIDSKKAIVLTNAHVIQGAAQINVTLLDGRTFTATLIGSDPDFDLAVLKLDNASDLPALPMAQSEDLMPGETVIAIGNPLGFSHTVTTGVVSALDRSIKTNNATITDLIQIDAAINPGNSGGPLINLAGELVGINTAMLRQAANIGFSIPIDKARRAVTELLETGHIVPVWLGLSGQNLDENTAAWLRLPSTKGLLVTAVFDGTPAAKAGIKSGDTIIEVNDNLVTDHRHYVQLLKNMTKGESVTLTYMRDGEPVTTKLRTKPYSEALAAKQMQSRWGMTLRKGKTYLVVESVRQGSPAARLGLRAGDVLVNISGKKVTSMTALYQAFFTHRLDSSLILFVGRDGKGYRVRMDI
ncbi:trypsin-like peptidase domain-containing protein [Halodesulfovibrio marinisediminis]|uniref:Serine protease, S1-C subfamily, contains C-terminal PDZ domain n=1 Tax=Halodesulfovibrio marinisediminis DSM 17456 TaxID=1121457 RepID=A0A1N6F9R4_9BACT|nr:trypsin-like peptidase domain-containing protein [Halodesulfovibrio marinisediminis]SIN92028.1 serine protease, S1-C subfamily, contains C-terminal PDZ domain [Halodesulfovibrio marinisediminis DSM 17456]